MPVMTFLAQPFFFQSQKYKRFSDLERRTKKGMFLEQRRPLAFLSSNAIVCL